MRVSSVCVFAFNVHTYKQFENLNFEVFNQQVLIFTQCLTSSVFVLSSSLFLNRLNEFLKSQLSTIFTPY